MLSIYVIDSTAEARNKIVSQLNSFLLAESRDHFLLPRFSIKPIALQELKFQPAPDVCIVGDVLVASELSNLSAIRKLIPNSVILVRTTKALESLSMVEQLARMGVNDTISDQISAHEFFRKIILLARNASSKKSGRLVLVDSGKGGLGCTSIVAALGELLANNNKKAVLIDLDFETQDLSRFLQVRPYINENLHMLFEQQRAVTEESVADCLTRVWADEENLSVMPPVSDSDEIYDSRSTSAKALLSVIEILDSVFDCVIVDMGSARGALMRTLYRVADNVVFVVNNDPAALFASADKISRVRGYMGASAKFVVLQNSPTKRALPANILKNEILRTARINEDQWLSEAIPFVHPGSHWPGSGHTLYELGNKASRNTLENLAHSLGVIESEEKASVSLWRKVFTDKKELIPAASLSLPKLESTKEAPVLSSTKRLELPFSKELVAPAMTPAVMTQKVAEEIQKPISSATVETDDLIKEFDEFLITGAHISG